MTRSPSSIMAKSAIARPTWRCSRLASLAISTGSLRRGARRRRARRCLKGDGGVETTIPTMRAVHGGLDDSSVSAALARLIGTAIDRAGGWIPFSRFMAMALYAPGLGYYASGRPIVGRSPRSGSDFVTAPELSPLFAARWRGSCAQALDAAAATSVWEFGAGSGALAAELLTTLGDRVGRYSIVELSAPLRERQRAATAALRRSRPLARRAARLARRRRRRQRGARCDAGRAHPFRRQAWLERGVVRGARRAASPGATGRATQRPPVEAAFPPGSTTELHAQAEAFVATLGDRLERGAIFLVDYGFPEHEYYHPQRAGGTLMCHRAHRADTDPLADIGLKDITAHLDFTALALAGQDAGLDVIGYASQASFLLDCGFAEMLAAANPRERADALKLVHEHEMGELFKVLAFAKGVDFAPIGFASGDRRHRL